MINDLLAFINNHGTSIFGEFWIVVWTLVKIACILLPLLGLTAFLTLWERKLIGWMHIRLGPNRIGPFGLLQPVADGIKAIFKEITIPAKANKFLFLTAPVISITAALLAWALIPFTPEFVLADINVGLLFIVAIVMFGIYGAVIAGWASNSRYATLGAMRAAAQMISFALVIGFILVTVAMVSGSLNLSEIVKNQNVGYFANYGANFLSWNWLPLFPMFVIYVISGMAETGRHPFDVIEGESEIVNGHMIEYSGISFALFFLAEYCNMILLSAMASIMFLGGWLPPLNFVPFTLIPGWIWLGGKTFLVVSMFIWVRASFPRYRYDQIMRLGWKVFLPITLFYIVFLAVWMKTPWNIW